VWIPYRVAIGRIQRIFNPLLKVTLPGVEQEAGGPQEDDCHMTKVGGESLVKPLLRHPIVAFKVVARSYPVPNRRVVGS